jgi:hypothetical protein
MLSKTVYYLERKNTPHIKNSKVHYLRSLRLFRSCLLSCKGKKRHGFELVQTDRYWPSSSRLGRLFGHRSQPNKREKQLRRREIRKNRISNQSKECFRSAQRILLGSPRCYTYCGSTSFSDMLSCR